MGLRRFSGIDTGDPAARANDAGSGAIPVRCKHAARDRGPGAAGAADYFREKIRASRGMAPVASNTGRGNAIVFRFDPAFRGTSPEAYALELKDNRATVTAKDARGLFYGGITLWQLLTADGGKGPVRIGNVRIEDAPRFAWRGFMLDSARHFWSVDQVERCSTPWRCTSSTPSTGT
jgi:hexosaminidase